MDVTGLGSVFQFGTAVLNKIFPDPAQRAQATLELEKLHQSGELAKLAAETDLLKGQLEINKEEAKSTSMFIAGWRPFIGWSCGFAFVYAAILDPIARFIALTLEYKGQFPVLDTSITMQVLMGLLGLGAMRTYEKVKGSEKNR